MGNTVTKDKFEIAETFIRSCIDKGITADTRFELLMIMAKEKIYDGKILAEKIDRAITES